MTDDELALLRAVRENPDDDLPRLVIADWYDERGEHARAEFVRVGCALAGMEEPGRVIKFWLAPDNPLTSTHMRNVCGACPLPDLCPYHALARREEELLGGVHATAGTNRVAWAEPVWRVVRVFGWDRGFVGRVTTDAAAWLSHGDAVLERHPVTQVSLSDEPGIYCVPRQGHVRVVVSGTAGVAGWDMPRPTETDPRDDRAMTALALAARWPGVSFALPPEPPRHPRGPTGVWVDAPFVPLFGDPAVPTPQGVFDVAEATARRSERPGHSRRQSDPAARTRFPRPR